MCPKEKNSKKVLGARNQSSDWISSLYIFQIEVWGRFRFCKFGSVDCPLSPGFYLVAWTSATLCLSLPDAQTKAAGKSDTTGGWHTEPFKFRQVVFPHRPDTEVVLLHFFVGVTKRTWSDKFPGVRVSSSEPSESTSPDQNVHVSLCLLQHHRVSARCTLPRPD